MPGKDPGGRPPEPKVDLSKAEMLDFKAWLFKGEARIRTDRERLAERAAACFKNLKKDGDRLVELVPADKPESGK